VEIALGANVALQKLRCYNGTMHKVHIQHLSDEQLLHELETTAALERGAMAQLIALLAEMDTRQLYLAQGYSSLFTYCTRGLRLSEHAPYGRIEAARAARRFPVILDSVADGSLTLTSVCLLASCLTVDNHQQVLAAARYTSKREVEHQVAALRPMPPVPSSIRKLPQARTSVQLSVAGFAAVADDVPPPPTVRHASPEPTGAPPVRCKPTVVVPLAPEHYKVQLTIGRDTHKKLRTIQDLMRHVVPDGDPAVIFDRALTLLLRDLERTTLARVDRPGSSTPSVSPRSRHVPAAVRREVWARDDGQCAFSGVAGRCAERGFLEFHHVIPFADGGSTTTDNLQLRCRAHNAFEAKQDSDSLLVRERPTRYQLGPDRVEYPPGCASRYRVLTASQPNQRSHGIGRCFETRIRQASSA
jgi:hypothetical protein